MSKRPKNIQTLEKGETLKGTASTGVSLHCHSRHSKEMLDFVPYYASRIPVASYFWDRHQRKSLDRNEPVVDFSRGFWTPPLTATDVVASEVNSIRSLDLEEGLVSLTDHDCIDGGLEIMASEAHQGNPISFEWTVPFENAFFHIGVHNLPPASADAIFCELVEYSHTDGAADNDRLHDLFALLNDLEGVLVVLNHPIWDIEMIGQQAHEEALARFIGEHAQWLHAIEINGFRSWNENLQAVALADSIGLPTVSGGDRHCLQPNTMINVTNARCFEEFVHEVRTDMQSSIIVLPEYRRSLPVRQLRSIAQILGRFDDFPEGRQLWHDRVFIYSSDTEGLQTLTERWSESRPLWTYAVFLALYCLNLRAASPIINWAIGDNDIGREDGGVESEHWMPNVARLAE